MLRNELKRRSADFLNRICQGASSANKQLGSLYFSPQALEILLNTMLEFRAQKLLSPLTRELSRTHSTQWNQNDTVPSALTLRLAAAYERLADAHYQLGSPGTVFTIYSTAQQALVPCNQIMYKRIVQALFKLTIPSPDPDQRRYSRPRTHSPQDQTAPPDDHRPSNPPVNTTIERLQLVLNHMAAENVIPNSRLLADIFRGLGSILKLETHGIEATSDPAAEQNATHGAPGAPGDKSQATAFRLEHLVLDQETWLTIGRIVNNILSQTVDTSRFQQLGNEAQLMILMAWAEVMVSLREDIADARVRTTNTKIDLNALSNRVDGLLAADFPWNYQRTFDRLARSSFLRPHHENSFNKVDPEADPTLDLPVGSSGQWHMSRTLNEAQRISLLIRDRLVERDSVAALFHFRSLASLCGTLLRLCNATDPKDAPSLFTHGSGNDFQHSPAMVLAEAQKEFETRVESVYVRLAGHALRTGDPSYVNDVLELAYTLPPRRNAYTFSRIWKRAMAAFVGWRAEWYGSGGIGRAFKTLTQLLGIWQDQPPKDNSDPERIDQHPPRAVPNAGPRRESFDLSWLRKQETWPAMGRYVFPRPQVICALIDKAEEATPVSLRPGAKSKVKGASKHLRDIRRLLEEAEARKTMRQLKADHQRYMPQNGDQFSSNAGLGTRAKIEAHTKPVRNRGHKLAGARSGGDGRINARPHNLQSTATPITTLINILGALRIPLTTDEARRLGYPHDYPAYGNKFSLKAAPQVAGKRTL